MESENYVKDFFKEFSDPLRSPHTLFTKEAKLMFHANNSVSWLDQHYEVFDKKVEITITYKDKMDFYTENISQPKYSRYSMPNFENPAELILPFCNQKEIDRIFEHCYYNGIYGYEALEPLLKFNPNVHRILCHKEVELDGCYQRKWRESSNITKYFFQKMQEFDYPESERYLAMNCKNIEDIPENLKSKYIPNYMRVEAINEVFDKFEFL